MLVMKLLLKLLVEEAGVDGVEGVDEDEVEDIEEIVDFIVDEEVVDGSVVVVVVVEVVVEVDDVVVVDVVEVVDVVVDVVGGGILVRWTRGRYDELIRHVQSAGQFELHDLRPVAAHRMLNVKDRVRDYL